MPDSHLSCPSCDQPRVLEQLEHIECPMCGLKMPTNDAAKYGSTRDRWRKLAPRIRPDAVPKPGGGLDAAPAPPAKD